MKTFSDEKNLRELVTSRLARRNKEGNDVCVKKYKRLVLLSCLIISLKDK